MTGVGDDVSVSILALDMLVGAARFQSIGSARHGTDWMLEAKTEGVSCLLEVLDHTRKRLIDAEVHPVPSSVQMQMRLQPHGQRTAERWARLQVCAGELLCWHRDATAKIHRITLRVELGRAKCDSKCDDGGE